MTFEGRCELQRVILCGVLSVFLASFALVSCSSATKKPYGQEDGGIRTDDESPIVLVDGTLTIVAKHELKDKGDKDIDATLDHHRVTDIEYCEFGGIQCAPIPSLSGKVAGKNWKLVITWSTFVVFKHTVTVDVTDDGKTISVVPSSKFERLSLKKLRHVNGQMADAKFYENGDLSKPAILIGCNICQLQIDYKKY